jgi:hypothetical protein
VDSALNIDCGFSSAGVGTGVLSMSSSLDSGTAGSSGVSLNESPKPLPNKEPLEPAFGASLSFAVFGSALKVVPRTKGDDPRVEVFSLLAGRGKEVDVSIETSGALVAKLPEGFEPNTLVDPPVLAKDPNPPLLAKFANPPDEGEAEAVLPNTLPGLGLALAKPDCPNAGAAAPADADAQGDAFAPMPITED